MAAAGAVLAAPRLDAGGFQLFLALRAAVTDGGVNLAEQRFVDIGRRDWLGFLGDLLGLLGNFRFCVCLLGPKRRLAVRTIHELADRRVGDRKLVLADRTVDALGNG